MRVSQDFTKQRASHIASCLPFIVFRVFVSGCVCSVSDLAALQTSTDVSGGAVGSHSIEEAPGSSEAFSLPLGSVWAAELNLPLPSPAPGQSLHQNYKGPPTAGSSLCSPSFSQPPPTPLRLPASISCRYSIHRRRALITKQDYGPCLGTTCQGACSLSCLLSTTHTLQSRVFVCVFLERRWRFHFLRWRRSPNKCKIFSKMSLFHQFLMSVPGNYNQ